MSKPEAPPAVGEIAIFGRLLRNGQEEMSPDLARYVLTLGFSNPDQARMTDLAARNQDGGLAPAEKDELFGYVKAAHLLALLHAQARRALKKRNVPGGPHGRKPGTPGPAAGGRRL